MNQEKVNKLIVGVLKWWEEHQYDVISWIEDGWAEEDSIYSEPPDFVKIALELNIKK